MSYSTFQATGSPRQEFHPWLSKGVLTMEAKGVRKETAPFQVLKMKENQGILF